MKENRVILSDMDDYFEYKSISEFIRFFIKEQNDDYMSEDCYLQEDIMLDSLARYLKKENK